LPYLLNSVSAVESGGYGKYPLVRGIDEFIVDILDEVVLRQRVSGGLLDLLRGVTLANPVN